MKTTFFYTAAAATLADSALGFHLPAFLAPRQQPPPAPRCSVYSGFADSPSFTSFCKQLPRPTGASSSVVAQPGPSSSGFSTRWIPPISTEYFTFDGGRTSTISPIEPVISSAAGGNTYVMDNYTVTTSGLISDGATSSTPTPSEYEVHCEIDGSTLPMSQCSRTTALTHHHGYTYTPSGLAVTSSKPAPSEYEVHCEINGTPVSMSQCTKTAALPHQNGSTLTHSTAPVTSDTFSSSLLSSAASSRRSSSSQEPSNMAGSSTSVTTTSVAANTTAAATLGSVTTASGDTSSTTCTNTQNLTRHGGYTYPNTLSLVPLGTASAPSSMVASSTNSSSICTNTMNLTRQGGYTYPDTLSLVPLSTGPSSSTVVVTNSSVDPATTSSTAFKTGSSVGASVPAAGTGVTNCGNITGAEPHGSHTSPTASLVTRTLSVSSSGAITSASPGPSISFPSAASFSNSYDCSNITAAEPHRPSLVTKSKPIATTSSQIGSSSSDPAASASTITSSPALTTSSTLSTSFVNSYDCSNITAAEPHQRQSISRACSISTSILTVVDATVTTVVPCSTDTATQAIFAKQKRDPWFMQPSADKLCDAGVYCVNSTFVSDAPLSWGWDAVELKVGQNCVEDDVFNTDWLQAQCACAGL